MTMGTLLRRYLPTQQYFLFQYFLGCIEAREEDATSKGTEKGRHKQKHAHKDAQTQNKHTHTHKQTNKHTHAQKHAHTNTHAPTITLTSKHTHTHIHTNIPTRTHAHTLTVYTTMTLTIVEWQNIWPDLRDTNNYTLERTQRITISACVLKSSNTKKKLIIYRPPQQKKYNYAWNNHRPCVVSVDLRSRAAVVRRQLSCAWFQGVNGKCPTILARLAVQRLCGGTAWHLVMP